MGEDAIKIILIEDNPGDVRLVREFLCRTGGPRFDLEHVSRLSDALPRLAAGGIDVVLLDMSLPDGSGVEVVARLRRTDPVVPIVVLSSESREDQALRAVQAGAQDFLVKGQCGPDLLVRAVRYAMERRRLDDHLAYLAQHDQLTGLANRSQFREALRAALNRAERSKRPLALMFLDLDGFKIVNDNLGHEVGDLLLKTVAQRLQRCVRKVDTLARLGGDEFTLILEGINGANDAGAVAQKILETLEAPMQIDGHDVSVSASIGISLYPESSTDATVLTRTADAAMYRAKALGRSRYQFHTPTANEQHFQLRQLAEGLRRALERDEFVLHYQPQIDLENGGLLGIEALIRWPRAEGELMAAAAFVPQAEQLGFGLNLSAFVLRAACRQRGTWSVEGLPTVPVWVNLPSRLLQDPKLCEMVASILDQTALPAQYLGLELTGERPVESSEAGESALDGLKQLGIELAIDDFGAGQSSLSALKRAPIDWLKIDGSLVSGVCLDPDAAAIAGAVVDVAHNFGLGVVAEAVEAEDQAQFLATRGCHGAQGNLYAPPLPADDLRDWFDQWANGRGRTAEARPEPAPAGRAQTLKRNSRMSPPRTT